MKPDPHDYHVYLAEMDKHRICFTHNNWRGDFCYIDKDMYFWTQPDAIRVFVRQYRFHPLEFLSFMQVIDPDSPQWDFAVDIYLERNVILFWIEWRKSISQNLFDVFFIQDDKLKHKLIKDTDELC